MRFHSHRSYLSVLSVVCLGLPHLLWADDGRPEVISLDKFVVTPGRYQATTEATTAPMVISADTIQALPQVGDDLYRTLAHFPGLTADDYSARFWVRGAPHDQVLTRLDGLDLLEPFHLKDFDGALSIVDPRSIDRFTLHTGGFTSEYGNTSAAVMEFDTDAYPVRSERTSLNASITGMRAAHEGSFAQARGDWLVTARVGFPQVTFKMLGYEDLSANYHDLRAQVSYRLNDQHRLSFSFLRASDDLTYREADNPVLKSSYRSGYIWTRVLSDWTPELHTETVFSFTDLDTLRQGNGPLSPVTRLDLRDQRELRRFQVRQDWTYAASDDLFLRAGFDLQQASNRYRYDRFRQRAILRDGLPAIENENVTHHLKPGGDTLGLYFSPRFRLFPNTVVEPGLRYDRATINHSSAFSPRLNTAVTFGRNTLRAGWGIYRQHQDLHQLAVADGDLTFHPSERTEQHTLSLERPIGPLQLRVELYERRGANPPPRFENVSDGYQTFPEVGSDRLRFDPTAARARGAEFNLTRRTRRFDTSFTYVLAKTEEKLDGRWIPRSRDQRHTLGLNCVYTPNDRWRFAATWQYHTGWMTNVPVYELVALADGRQVIKAGYAGLYDRPLPAYHRLDFRINRRFRWGNQTLDVYLDLFNAYDRENLIGYSRSVSLQNGAIVSTAKAESQFSFLPNIGLSYEF